GTLSPSIDGTDTVLESIEFAMLPVIGANDYLAITLDPEGIFDDPEIVWIVDHGLGEDFLEVERGKEGTDARAHADGTVWVHAPTVKDYTTIVNTDGEDSIIFVGTIDPEVSYSPNNGDVWLDTGGA